MNNVLPSIRASQRKLYVVPISLQSGVRSQSSRINKHVFEQFPINSSNSVKPHNPRSSSTATEIEHVRLRNLKSTKRGASGTFEDKNSVSINENERMSTSRTATATSLKPNGIPISVHRHSFRRESNPKPKESWASKVLDQLQTPWLNSGSSNNNKPDICTTGLRQNPILVSDTTANAHKSSLSPLLIIDVANVIAWPPTQESARRLRDALEPAVHYGLRLEEMLLRPPVDIIMVLEGKTVGVQEREIPTKWLPKTPLSSDVGTAAVATAAAARIRNHASTSSRIKFERASPGWSGDDVLVSLVSAQTDRNVIVITADRELQQRVLSLGARVHWPRTVRRMVGPQGGEVRFEAAVDIPYLPMS